MKKTTHNIIPPAICVIITLLCFIFNSELKESIISGMNLAALRILPTLFPFMILSDFWINNVKINESSRIGLIFERIFKINKNALNAFVTGIFAGFPLGVKSAADLYSAGTITYEELSRLVPIINLPSLAFVISGVGLGLYNDIKSGIILYFSVLISSVICGYFQGKNKPYSQHSNDISRQSFNLTESIKQAGLSSVTISSYIIFFSGLIGLTSALLHSRAICAIISAFMEIGNAAVIISKESSFSKDFSLILTSFALGFSGFSVHLQAFSFLPLEISRTKYLITKLIIGILSSIITFIALTIT